MSLALARRALVADARQRGTWNGVAGTGLLILLGATESLPWVDGAVYLGPGTRLEDLLAGGASLWNEAEARVASLDVLVKAAHEADLAPVRPHLAHALRTLRAAGCRTGER